jgi:MYXO-CTERM domain-containing protein
VCTEGFCTPPPTPCKNHHDCDVGEDCVGKVCVPPTGDPCGSDSDCAGGYCEGGYCEPPHPPIPCVEATDCPSGDECIGGYCEPPQGCEFDYQCPGGELCDDGTCRPGQPPEPCVVDSDCPPGEDDVYPPVCYGGFCTPSGGDCDDDIDCPGGMVCVDGDCVGAEDPTPCTSQYDCGGAAVCNGGFCEPTDWPDGCEVPEDCPRKPEDDVGPACVGGVCTTSRIAPPACAAPGECSHGTECSAGVCTPIAGACELDSDCGANCIDGWCGISCTETAECSDGAVCARGRCVAPCATYAECGGFDACLAGGCVPLPAVVAAGYGGDQSLWKVDLPGESPADVGGGCGCSTAASASGSGGAVWWIVLMAPLVLRRRRRRRMPSARYWVLPIVCAAGLAMACGGGAAEGDDDDDTGPDAGAIVDATPSADAEHADADYSDSPYLLITCDGDAPVLADAGPGDLDGGLPPGIDSACCDPTGMCAGDLACIQGPTAEEHRCRPRCDLVAGDCPAGGVCADFAGSGVCIPASLEGLPCAPELCDGATICVGDTVDDATCHRRCAEDTDCDEGQSCTDLLQTDTKACL